MNEVQIFLTTPEALLFKDFQEFHATFALLVQKGVFDTKFGSVTLNFADGEIKTIEKKEIIYHK